MGTVVIVVPLYLPQWEFLRMEHRAVPRFYIRDSLTAVAVDNTAQP